MKKDTLCLNLQTTCAYSIKMKSENAKSECEALRPQAGASRKGYFVHIVPLDPAYKAGLAGHIPVNGRE